MVAALSCPIAQRGIAEAGDHQDEEKAHPEDVLHDDAPATSRRDAQHESIAGDPLGSDAVGIRDDEAAERVVFSYE
jgi:hypothetical protein